MASAGTSTDATARSTTSCRSTRRLKRARQPVPRGRSPAARSAREGPP
jgi:hypothetical protein